MGPSKRRTNYHRGRGVEWLARNQLRKWGYIAERTAGSHGPFDIIATNAAVVRLIQVKRKYISPGELDELKAFSKNVPPGVGVSVEAWVKVPRRPFRIIYVKGPYHQPEEE